VPGEITLAHNGVLFMDEVCEYDTNTIEALRTPIEEKKIVHFRKGDSYVFPCNFQLVMAANPCPCGYFGDSKRMCKCSEAQLERYRKKLSGPMMDRIDMRISMEKVEFEDLRTDGPLEGDGRDSASVRISVERAISFAHRNGRTGYNADMSESEIDMYCALGPAEEKFMKRAYDALKMTPRSYKKTLKVARTIADLACSKEIHEEHLAEALSYRMLDQVNE
jgi:magnesium chelatase family protein